MSKINLKTLPFLEIKRIVNLKGRDILWIALKPYPNHLINPAFGMKSKHLNIYSSNKVLYKFDISITTIAIICENIWRRRNKKVHEGITLQNIRKEQLIHELVKTQTAMGNNQTQTAMRNNQKQYLKLIGQEKKAANN
ncbi:hypothetical protein ACTFIZ_005268 [Dictyostelium cf. discoideum]